LSNKFNSIKFIFYQIKTREENVSRASGKKEKGSAKRSPKTYSDILPKGKPISDGRNRKNRNDPCPRFSSADKGHFWSLLVSNIIFGYLHFFFYLLLPARESVKSCLLSSFSNESTVGFVLLLVGVRKRRVVQ
jgi:hypothetical protein